MVEDSARALSIVRYLEGSVSTRISTLRIMRRVSDYSRSIHLCLDAVTSNFFLLMTF